jgi:hypothetical protein
MGFRRGQLFLLLMLGLLFPPYAAAQEGTGGGTGEGTGELGVGSDEPLEPAEPGFDATERLEAATVEVTVPVEELTVGDPIPFNLQISLPPGFRMSSVTSVGAGHLEFQDRWTEEIERPDGGFDIDVTVIFSCYRAGHHTVEGFLIHLMWSDGGLYELRAPGGDVRINSVIANEQDPQLRPQKGGTPVLYRDYTLAWIVGIGGALVAMGALGLIIARRRPRVIYLPPPPPPRPAHEVALEKLDKIRDENLVETIETKVFYIELSGAVREYLGLRYQFNALDMTTSEILEEMEGTRLSRDFTREMLRHLLFGYDLVKFARQGADIDEKNEALGLGYRLVHETMIRALAFTSNVQRPPSDGAAAEGSEE